MPIYSFDLKSRRIGTVAGEVRPALPYSVVSTVSASTAETVHAFGMPPNVAAGDMIIVFYTFDKQTGTTVTLDTGASGNGWTNSLLEATGARGFSGVARKIATGSDVLQFTTSFGEQSQAFAVCVSTTTGDSTLASLNVGVTSSPNPPLCAPAFGSATYVWMAAAASVVLDNSPAVTSSFVGFPSGYVDTYTLTGAPNNPSLALAVKVSSAATEDPGVFLTSRTETAITHTVGVRLN